MSHLDAVIIGGGIAGLFTLAKLKNAGFSAVLLDKNALGNGQTLKSQGIIHGGTKYALLGSITEAQRHIAGMPSYWRECIAGQGDVDLSACRVFTDKQTLWAPNLSSRVTGFFASRAMQSHVAILPESDKASALKHADCHGQFYALDEPVLDIYSLMNAFLKNYGEYILTDVDVDAYGSNVHAKSKGSNGMTWDFEAERVIVTAGSGNADFAKQQLRPLRMVFASVPKDFGQLFLHVLEASDKPRLTISTHFRDDSDELIWYLGGNVAEKGATLTENETIALAKKELQILFPWLDFSTVQFGTVLVNRAEGLSDGKRPDTPIIIEKGPQLVAWPTKLALAPMLADSLLTHFQTSRHDSVMPNFTTPRVASPFWC